MARQDMAASSQQSPSLPSTLRLDHGSGISRSHLYHVELVRPVHEESWLGGDLVRSGPVDLLPQTGEVVVELGVSEQTARLLALLLQEWNEGFLFFSERQTLIEL